METSQKEEKKNYNSKQHANILRGICHLLTVTLLWGCTWCLHWYLHYGAPGSFWYSSLTKVILQMYLNVVYIFYQLAMSYLKVATVCVSSSCPNTCWLRFRINAIPNIFSYCHHLAWQPTPAFLSGESPWTEKPGRLQSMRSQRIRHDWVAPVMTSTYLS